MSTPSSFPNVFAIGECVIPPVVTTVQLRGHLGLLRAFNDLRIKVCLWKNEYAQIAHLEELDYAQRWAWFVSLAVERFERFCNALPILRKLTSDIMPPLDVVMVWHAYMLNPIWYAEDCSRLSTLRPISKQNAIMMNMFGEAAHAIPTLEQVAAWTQATDLPFDPLDSAVVMQSKRIFCPECSKPLNAPFLDHSERGYAQQGFMVVCGTHIVTREGLGARKFFADLCAPNVERTIHRGSVAKNDTGVVLAGTLHDANGINYYRAGNTKAAISDLYMLRANRGEKDEARIRRILSKMNYSMAAVQTALKQKMELKGGTLLPRIMSAYVDDRPFSIDLVGAVLRQGTFITKMHDMQWTQPDFFKSPEDSVALQHAVARYHAFLDLIAAAPTPTLYVPTLDIDLVWHTHQLTAGYQADCQKYTKRYIDHDDKVERGNLLNGFSSTCRAWEARFGVPYMCCGCPMSGKTIGSKLSRLVSSSSGKRKCPHLELPEDSVLPGTHPSDHDAILVEGKKSSLLRKLSSASAGTSSGPTTVLPPDASTTHSQAFLTPVPIYCPDSYYNGEPGTSIRNIQGCGSMTVGTRAIVNNHPLPVNGLSSSTGYGSHQTGTRGHGGGPPAYSYSGSSWYSGGGDGGGGSSGGDGGGGSSGGGGGGGCGS